MSDLCAPTTAAVPQPVVAAPAVACQAAEPLNQPITSAEVESALPLLNNNRFGAGQGWPVELLRYAYREVQDEDDKTLKFHVLAPLLAVLLDAAFQRGILPDDVKSSLVTPVFKKGDKCDPTNYRPIAVGEPGSAVCMLPSSTAAVSARLKKLACELLARRASGYIHRASDDQLFALRHFIDRSRLQKEPLFAAFVDLRKAYDSVQPSPLGIPTAQGSSWQSACSHTVIVQRGYNEHENLWQGKGHWHSPGWAPQSLRLCGVHLFQTF